jgi:hypothetical protein
MADSLKQEARGPEAPPFEGAQAGAREVGATVERPQERRSVYQAS